MTKELALKLVNTFPRKFDLDFILYELIVADGLDKSLNSKGRTYTHEEMKAIVETWKKATVGPPYSKNPPQRVTREEIEKELLKKGSFTAEFENVLMWIQYFPHSDRGRFLWNAESNNYKITIDHADAFPRYYFYMESLVNEINVWIEKRKKQIGERKDKDPASNGRRPKPKEYPIGDE